MYWNISLALVVLHDLAQGLEESFQALQLALDCTGAHDLDLHLEALHHWIGP